MKTAYSVNLSDPSYNDGEGERMFIATFSEDLCEKDLDEGFFKGDIVTFGATAVCPKLNSSLYSMLKRVKKSGGITIVNTVYDYISEKKCKESRWFLGENDECYAIVDLLIMNSLESKRLSGKSSIKEAVEFF